MHLVDKELYQQKNYRHSSSLLFALLSRVRRSSCSVNQLYVSHVLATIVFIACRPRENPKKEDSCQIPCTADDVPSYGARGQTRTRKGGKKEKMRR